MRTRSFDLYGGLLPAGFVSDNAHPVTKEHWPKNPEFWTGNPLKSLPVDVFKLRACLLSISSFKTKLVLQGSAWSGYKLIDYSGLHVGVWLSWGDKPLPKEHDDVFMHGNTGDSGACNISLTNLDIPVLPSQKYTINFWAHSMRPDPVDWHCNGVLVLE